MFPLLPSLALFALALAGHLASLSLIDAPPYAVFQHYRPWSALLDGPPIGTVVLAGQALVCLWLAYRMRANLVGGLRRIAPPACLLLAAVVLGFSAAVPTQSVNRFAGEVLLSCVVMALAGLNLLLVVLVLPDSVARWVHSRLSARLMTIGGQSRWWDRRVAVVAAIWVLVVSSGLAFFVFGRVPHIDDDICYLIQAKYMSAGVLWLPRPPDPDSFGVAHLIVDGDKWYGKFFPGWPAVLVPGVIAGVPWLMNPLLAAASILLVHRLIHRIYDLKTAHAVTLLVSASPWLLFLSASFMAHAAALFWMLLALVAIDAQRERGAGTWSLIAGISLGMLFLTRPFDAALIGPVAGLWALGLGARRLSTGALVITGLSAALVAGLYFLYNAVLTGDPMLAPHELWADRLFGPGVDVFGFGPNIGVPLWRNVDPLPGHGLADIVLNANKNFSLLNFELFGWAAGSLVLACIALQPGAIGRRDALIIGMLLSVIGGHSFYWAPGGPDFGARYWYLLIVPLAVLTVRGAEIAIARLTGRGQETEEGGQGKEGRGQAVAGRAIVWVALASLSALLTVMPWRSVTKYDRYRDIGREFQDVADRRGIRDALIFVRSSRRSDYQAAFNFNPIPLDRGGNIFVHDAGGTDHSAAVLQHFPGRAVWVVGRESDSDRTIDVIAGPLPPGTPPPGPAVPTPDSLQAIIR